jgi:Protein kinase domain
VLPALPCEVDGRYTIVSELGHGSHAIVYRAVDRLRNCDVAIKVLRPELVNSDLSARFRREIRLTSQLDHPHIAHVYDTGELDGIPYFVTAIAVGETLCDRLVRERQLAVEDALAIAFDIASALSHAHHAGIIHRDVKPANTLLALDGALLADFGVARALELVPGTLATSTGVAVGTLLYMSPEQLCAEKDIDARCDQYALALMLYEMLAGVPPHISANAEGLRALRISGQHAPVRAHRPSVPLAVDSALQRALSPNPADRFRSVMDFATALTSQMVGALPTTVRAPLDRAVSPWLGRKPRAAAVAGVLVVAAAIAVRAATEARSVSGPLMMAELNTIPTSFALTASGETAQATEIVRTLAAELRAWPTLRAVVAARNGVPNVTTLETSVTSLAGATLISVRLVSGVGNVAHGRTVQMRLLDSASLSQDSLRVLAGRILMATIVATDSTDALTRVTSRSVTAVREYALGWRSVLRGDLERAETAFAASTLAGGIPQAVLWRATVASWRNPSSVRAWQSLARAAVDLAPTLSTRDSLYAAGLNGRAAGAMKQACQTAERATRIDGGGFAAWFSFAECLRSDSTVVRDRTSPTGAKFQSSYWVATRAYEEAISRLPSAAFVQLFGALPRVTLALNATQRRGRSIGVGSESFAGLPSLIGDSVAIFPLPLQVLANAGNSAVPPSYQRAVERGRSRLLELSKLLVQRAPGNVVAQLQFARALEYAGVLTAPPSETSALSVLALASGMARTRTDSLDVNIALTRVHLRLAQFTDARAASLRVLRFVSSATPDEAERLAPVAILVGDTASAKALLVRTNIVSSAQPDGLPAHLALLHASYTVAAADGACISLVALRTELIDALREHHAAADLGTAYERWLATGDAMQQTCRNAPRPVGVNGRNMLANAFDAWHAGDTARVLDIVTRMLADRNGASASAVAWDTRLGEIWLLTHSGDSVAARGRIAAALQGLSGTMDYTVSYLPQSAAFRQFLRICSQSKNGATGGRSHPALTCDAALAALTNQRS